MSGACGAACFPTAPKGNGTQTGHKYVASGNVISQRNQQKNSGEADQS